MKSIYKGNLKRLTVTNFSLKENNVRILNYNTKIIRNDMLFYRGLGNTFISFDYGTRLLDEAEAMDLLCEELSRKENLDDNPNANCIFANPDEIRFEKKISNQEFKQLKKILKKGGK